MSAPSPPDLMNRLITGYWTTQMDYLAAKLGLADLLATGRRTADDLAKSTGVNTDALYRLPRGLASLGVLTRTTAAALHSRQPRLACTTTCQDRSGPWPS